MGGNVLRSRLLLAHCGRVYLRVLGSCLSTFGLRRAGWFLYFLLKIPARLGYIAVSLLLDNLFFPKYRRAEIKNPVFIIGHPRSGTTFLHALLTQTEEFAVFKNWEILHPALTARALLKRSRLLRALFSVRIDPRSLQRLMRRQAGSDGEAAPLHLFDPALESIVQEEEILFSHILDTQFVAFNMPLGFGKRGYPELVFHDEQPHQRQSVEFLKSCLKRQIHATGRGQVVAKVNFSLFRLKTLFEAFPDAKIVYLVRSPLETIPSHLSLHRTILDNNFGRARLSDARIEQYFAHRYRYNVAFYERFEQLMGRGDVPPDRILEIRYESLKNDLGKTMGRIRDFTGLPYSPDLERRIRDQEKKQPGYRREHTNLPLSAFGLNEEQVRADLDFVFKRYGFDDPPSRPAPPGRPALSPTGVREQRDAGRSLPEGVR
jgi:hypothetical protein